MPDERSYLVGHDGGQREQSDRRVTPSEMPARLSSQWQEIVHRDHPDRGCQCSEQADDDEPCALLWEGSRWVQCWPGVS